MDQATAVGSLEEEEKAAAQVRVVNLEEASARLSEKLEEAEAIHVKNQEELQR